MFKCNACGEKCRDKDALAEHITGLAKPKEGLPDQAHFGLLPWVEKHERQKTQKSKGVIAPSAVPGEVPSFLVTHKNGKVKADAVAWARALAQAGKFRALRLKVEESRALKLERLLISPEEYKENAPRITEMMAEINAKTAKQSAENNRLLELKDHLKAREKAVAKKEKGE